MALEITGSFIEEACGNGMVIYETTEGLFVSQDNRILALPMAESSQKIVDKFLLTEEDLIRYKNFEMFRHLAHQACLNLKLILRSFKGNNDSYLMLEDYDGTKLIVYARDNAVWLPKCVPVGKVFIEDLNNNNKCVNGVNVSFTIGETSFKGILNEDSIIRATAKEIECGDQIFQVKNMLIKRSSSSITVTKIEAAHVVKLNPFNFNQKLHFLHSKIILNGFEALNEFSSIVVSNESSNRVFNTKTASNFVAKTSFVNLFLIIYEWRWLMIGAFALITVIIFIYICKLVDILGSTLRAMGNSILKIVGIKWSNTKKWVNRKRKNENIERENLSFKRLRLDGKSKEIAQGHSSNLMVDDDEE